MRAACWCGQRKLPIGAGAKRFSSRHWLGCPVLYERDPDAIMGSFAADQVIGPDEVFREAVSEAIATARTDKIVTIGIKPTYPSTGFGYIRQGEKLNITDAPSAYKVDKFVEKPASEVAQRYV